MTRPDPQNGEPANLRCRNRMGDGRRKAAAILNDMVGRQGHDNGLGISAAWQQAPPRKGPAPYCAAPAQAAACPAAPAGQATGGPPPHRPPPSRKGDHLHRQLFWRAAGFPPATYGRRPSEINCLGRLLRLSGHRRVPDPPHRMTGITLMGPAPAAVRPPPGKSRDGSVWHSQLPSSARG